MEMMKKIISASIECLTIAGLAGCCNIRAHMSDHKEPAGVYRGVRECSYDMAHPFRRPGEGKNGLVIAYFPVIFPIVLVDLVFEVAADTITFPYDLVALCVTGKDEERDCNHNGNGKSYGSMP